MKISADQVEAALADDERYHRMQEQVEQIRARIGRLKDQAEILERHLAQRRQEKAAELNGSRLGFISRGA